MGNLIDYFTINEYIFLCESLSNVSQQKAFKRVLPILSWPEGLRSFDEV